MAKTGAMLWNPVSKTMAVFETCASDGAGLRLAVEWQVAPGEKLPSGKHVHGGPDGYIGERFDVLEGSCTMIVDERRIDATAGDTVEVPVNTTHVHPWNTGEGLLRVRQAITPDRPNLELTSGVERFFEALVGFSQQGKADREGNFSGTLQQALSVHDLLMPWTWPAVGPAWLLRPAFGLLAAIARARGLSAWCEPDWTLRP
ncbi:MAG: cupin domain-containing protein [Oricola sp.]